MARRTLMKPGSWSAGPQANLSFPENLLRLRPGSGVAKYEALVRQTTTKNMSATANRSMRQSDYEALANFRYVLRRFLHFSSDAAAEAGLETQQYQALLAIRSARAPVWLTIGGLASQLLIQHHSAVGLVSRLERQKLVERKADIKDKRRVFVVLTPKGRSILTKLAAAHKEELKNAIPAFKRIIELVQRSTR
jgi:DNA-binding MarR family transcriptional regulator